MFKVFFRSLSPVLTAFGLIAIYGYATGQNINDLVTVTLEAIEPYINSFNDLIQGFLNK